MNCKVTLKNTFHNSEVNVIGELVTVGEGDGDPYSYVPPAGYACVRLTESQVRRATAKLCGIDTCQCGNHMPHFDLGSDGKIEVEAAVAR